jgi:hypothetical protein
MAKFLGVEEGENVVYADDSNVWQTGSNLEEVVRKLTEKAAFFVDYTRSMGLSMNALKTQLLLSANAGNVSEVTMEVDGNTILPCNVIEVLGVHYDRKLLFTDKTATAKTTWSARTGQITVPLRGVTPLSRTRPMCGTGRSRYPPRPRRWLQRRRLQILQISHHSSQDPPCKTSPPACSSWGVPCGLWGVSCGTWGVSPGAWAKSFVKLDVSGPGNRLLQVEP